MKNSNNKGPLKAIHKKCVECSGDNQKEVKHCEITDCALHPYRFGHNPNRQGVGRKINISRLPDAEAVQSEMAKISPTQSPEKPERTAPKRRVSKKEADNE